MQLFQEFDEETKSNPETKISVAEKTLLLGLNVVIKVALRKMRRAKTYGDLYKLLDLIEKNLDKERIEDEDPEVVYNDISEKLANMVNDLEKN